MVCNITLVAMTTEAVNQHKKYKLMLNGCTLKILVCVSMVYYVSFCCFERKIKIKKKNYKKINRNKNLTA